MAMTAKNMTMTNNTTMFLHSLRRTAIPHPGPVLKKTLLPGGGVATPQGGDDRARYSRRVKSTTNGIPDQ